MGEVNVQWPALRQQSPLQEVELEDKRTTIEERLVQLGALPRSAVTERLRSSGQYMIPEGWAPDDDEGQPEPAGDSAPQLGVSLDAEVGDGTKMALVFRLPGELAIMRPSIEPWDDSPAHVTFCYLPVVANPELVRALVAPLIAQHIYLYRATLGDMEHMLNQQGQVVVYQDVRIKHRWRLLDLREQIVEVLTAHGIPVAWPAEWRPHLTLAYLSPEGTFVGSGLTGSWHLGALELWGGPEVITLPLGGVHHA
jgi:hypothetical protein